MNNKAYNCYGEQKMGYKYYKQSVIDFSIHNDNKLSKEIKRFNELCEKTQINNKNKEIKLSLDNFKGFLEIMNNEYNKDSLYNNFYWLIFIKFVERIKQIYKSKEPLTIDINTVKLSYILKRALIKNNQIKYINQLISFMNNDNIEWDINDKNSFKQFINDNFLNIETKKENETTDEIKAEKKEIIETTETKDEIKTETKETKEIKENKEEKMSFSKYREKIINFKINYKDDIYEQTKTFYYLCEEIQKLNKEKTNLSLNNIYDIVNKMVDGYYYGLSANNITIIKFYYNLIFQFIRRIQTLFIQSKTYKNITINNNTVNFTIMIKKICNNNGQIKYKNQALKFIEECNNLFGWKEKDKKELKDWLNSFNN